jgi:P-type Ca2+ transporter type 2C
MERRFRQGNENMVHATTGSSIPAIDPMSDLSLKPPTETQHPIYAGLSSAEVSRRLEKFGLNEMPKSERRTVLRILVGVLTEPMFLLLLAAAVAYLIFGSLAEGIMMFAFASTSIGLVVFQERRGERAIEALASFAEPEVRVIRDGVEKRVPANQLVPGDALMIGEGERVGADGLLHQGNNIKIDESLLTGESFPVKKTIALPDENFGQAVPGGDDQPFVFAGTLVVGGHGVVEVLATGSATRTGRIGLSLARIKSEITPLQRSIRGVVRLFGTLAGVVSIVFLILTGITTGNWQQAILSSLALSMAMVPEEFPMVLAVFTTLGARRLARIGVLARNAAAVETLGAVSVLCVDKTGTLTENHIVLDTVSSKGKSIHDIQNVSALPSVYQEILELSRLASGTGSADPIDRAIVDVVSRLLPDLSRANQLKHIRQYPLSPELLAVTEVWLISVKTYLVAAKGAPEAIIDLCMLKTNERNSILREVSRLASDGLRVLAVANGKFKKKTLPHSSRDFSFEFVGLIAFRDPLRSSVPKAVREAQQAGVIVTMITGDHPITAQAIARQAGIMTGGTILTGKEIDAMNDAELAASIQNSRVYARIMPEQKLRIVEALTKAGHVVGMTGDGVNDAPALKAAHIGIAMGQRGTDVAREASDLVLLEESFDRIISGIRLGRQIFDNLRKVMIYITAIHGLIVGIAILPLLFGLPAILFPVHVVVLEMVVDTICSIAFERSPAEADLMRRGPRAIGEPIISTPLLAIALLQSAFVLAGTFAIYAYAAQTGNSDNVVRAAVIITMVAGNLALVRVNMTREWTFRHVFEHGQQVYWTILVLTTLAGNVVFAVPELRTLFRFELPSWQLATLAAATGIACALCFDFIKIIPIVRRWTWQGNGKLHVQNH